MEILHLTPEFAVLLKAAGELSEGEGARSLPALLAARLAEMGERDEVYSVHRLDRLTAGLIVFARTKEAASSLSAAITQGKFEKEYLAVTEGVPAAEAGEFCDLLYFDRKCDKSYVVTRARKGVKEARLAYETLAKAETEIGKTAFVRVRLFTGRTHQIRVQFAHRKTPLCGDARYGAASRGALALFSASLSFPHPRTGKEWSISALPAPEGFFAPFAATFTTPAPIASCPK